MHFILDGRVGIMVNAGSAPIRVRSLGPHTTIGEMGLITQQPRSATMQAELASVLYELSASDYGRIKRENPGLIPNPIDQNPWAHWRSPMDMMRQG
jgi:sulfate permease, SulP family